MKLCEGEIGADYRIRSVAVNEALNRRLEALGVNEKTRISVLNKKKSGTMIIKVRGTRLALGRKITENIDVETEEAGIENNTIFKHKIGEEIDPGIITESRGTIFPDAIFENVDETGTKTGEGTNIRKEMNTGIFAETVMEDAVDYKENNTLKRRTAGKDASGTAPSDVSNIPGREVARP